MNAYMTEEEQVEAIKKWWAKFGNHLLTGILIILLAVMGIKWYRQYRFNIKVQASASFEQLMQHYAKKDETGVSAQSHYLLSNYPGTVYASGSALMLAKQAILDGKYDEAITQLSWVKDHADVNAVKQIARMRLARVFMMQKKYKKALSLLDTVDDKAYLMLVHEIKGDVFYQQGDRQEAKAQYTLAIKEVPKKTVVPPELKMKLNHVKAPIFQVASAETHRAFKPPLRPIGNLNQ